MIHVAKQAQSGRFVNSGAFTSVPITHIVAPPPDRHLFIASAAPASGAGITFAPIAAQLVSSVAADVRPGAMAPPTTLIPETSAAAAGRLVTIRGLDAALVGYLRLGGAARAFQAGLKAAGLKPLPNTGTEIVARMLGLRAEHPSSEDSRQLLPDETATRAEAAYSFAQLLKLNPADVAWVQTLAKGFRLPALDKWQSRLLTTAVSYIGYPYVWGGTSPTAEAPFGVEAPGGFDCSGFVWRIYKLTPYPGEGDLATVIKGRTTEAMAGAVPGAERITAGKLEPGDVMFFGVGPHSKAAEISHAAIYLGHGWMIQAADQGVSIAPFADTWKASFAWAARPLSQAGLDV
jgi:cell wall-associated NlpC family hydrolase